MTPSPPAMNLWFQGAPFGVPAPEAQQEVVG